MATTQVNRKQNDYPDLQRQPNSTWIQPRQKESLEISRRPSTSPLPPPPPRARGGGSCSAREAGRSRQPWGGIPGLLLASVCSSVCLFLKVCLIFGLVVCCWCVCLCDYLIVFLYDFVYLFDYCFVILFVCLIMFYYLVCLLIYGYLLLVYLCISLPEIYYDFICLSEELCTSRPYRERDRQISKESRIELPANKQRLTQKWIGKGRDLARVCVFGRNSKQVRTFFCVVYYLSIY